MDKTEPKYPTFSHGKSAAGFQYLQKVSGIYSPELKHQDSAGLLITSSCFQVPLGFIVHSCSLQHPNCFRFLVTAASSSKKNLMVWSSCIIMPEIP
ncbi:hypothetical protein Y1Q_0022076 [Alligator mississippiensis]|uniref:Uncharacterized protein n=1 Tax=Alligator mississippiensis TaxID=8496 RepID=A0A151NTS1_ALLMI|nr:hypothetical protein Y1Q_0022076 [Alligator mississippiensis]